jgi:hypothetical protein
MERLYIFLTIYNEVQEPHPQPPLRKRGGGYDVPHLPTICCILFKPYNTEDLFSVVWIKV